MRLKWYVFKIRLFFWTIRYAMWYIPFLKAHKEWARHVGYNDYDEYIKDFFKVEDDEEFERMLKDDPIYRIVNQNEKE